MGIESILVITKAGLPLASYPEEVSPDRTVFSGILAALIESGKKAGMGEIDNIKMGDRNFLVKNFEDVVIIVTLNSEVEGGTLFLEALYGSMKKIMDFLAFDEGYVNESTAMALKNVIKLYYDSFNILVYKYRSLLDTYRTANKILGVKAFDMLRSFLSPYIEIDKVNDEIRVNSVNTDDPKTLINIIDSAINNMKKYLASML